jgi:hypothetical protein
MKIIFILLNFFSSSVYSYEGKYSLLEMKCVGQWSHPMLPQDLYPGNNAEIEILKADKKHLVLTITNNDNVKETYVYKTKLKKETLYIKKYHFLRFHHDYGFITGIDLNERLVAEIKVLENGSLQILNYYATSFDMLEEMVICELPIR